MFFYCSSDQQGTAKQLWGGGVCVCDFLCFMLYYFPWPAKLAWQQKEIVWDLLKRCIIYYQDLKSPITVFLTVIFHESLMASS